MNLKTAQHSIVYTRLLEFKENNNYSWQEVANITGITIPGITRYRKRCSIPNTITRHALLRMGIITNEDLKNINKEWYDKIHERRKKKGEA